MNHLKEKLHRISQRWISDGLPPYQQLISTADELSEWKRDHHVNGIWPKRPLMISATLDDGIGQGISIIERYAAIVGLEVNHLGLLQKPTTIIEECRRCQPDLLGLTILQLDTEDDLAQVGHNLPAKTCLIAGGPVFRFDPDMARRCGVNYTATNLAYFVRYLLTWTPATKGNKA